MVQKAIDFALIYDSNNSSKIDNVKLLLKRFPYPPYNDDSFVVAIIAIFPFIIVLSFCFTVILTAKAIVHEKETGLKNLLISLLNVFQLTNGLKYQRKTLR